MILNNFLDWEDEPEEARHYSRLSEPKTRKAMEIVDGFDEAMQLAESKDRANTRFEFTDRVDALNTANIQEDKKAVRLDVQFQGGHDETLNDYSIIHVLAQSHRRAEAKRTWEQLMSSVDSVKNKSAATAAIEAARRVTEQTNIILLHIIRSR